LKIIEFLLGGTSAKGARGLSSVGTQKISKVTTAGASRESAQEIAEIAKPTECEELIVRIED